VPCLLYFDRDLVPDIVDVAVQEVSRLLNRRAKCEAVSEFGQINRRPKLATESPNRDAGWGPRRFEPSKGRRANRNVRRVLGFDKWPHAHRLARLQA
jgi:hypothetical protein